MGRFKNNNITFKDVWLTHDIYKTWLRKATNDVYSAHCCLCRKTFSLSNMGVKALDSHAEGVKHMHNVKSRVMAESSEFSTIRGFLKPSPSTAATSTTTTTTPSVASTSTSTSSSTAALVNVAPDIVEPGTLQGKPTSAHLKSTAAKKRIYEMDEISKAEILWCLQTVKSHLSLSAAGSCPEVFKEMFCDSAIAQGMTLGRSKLAYMITYGLGPYFRRELLDDVDASLPFGVSFDESLNKISQMAQMDVLLRYWSLSSDLAVTMYLGSAFLGHTTAADLLTGLQDQLKVIETKKLANVSMDGPNVNLKLRKAIVAEIKNAEKDQPGLLDFGTCGLHTLHNSFKFGLNSTDWGLSKYLRALTNLLKNVPARRSDYIRLSESTEFPLKFCPHRWLLNCEVAKRAEKILPSVAKYVAGAKAEKIEPATKSYRIVEDCIKDPLLKAKLSFMQTLASEFEPILTAYQAEGPMVPFLYSDLVDLMKSLLKRVVKEDVLQNTSNVNSIDLTKESNLLSAKYVGIGHGPKAALRDVKVTEKQILVFRQECKVAIVNACIKLKAKSPLAYSLTKYLSFCDPALVASSLEVSRSHLSSLIQVLVEKGWLSGISGDRVERDFASLCSKPAVKQVAMSYSRKSERLDVFWKNVIADFGGSSELFNLLKLVFILSHGQADVERGFSVNKEILVENLSEKSLVSQRLVWQGVQRAGGVTKVSINKSMILFARNARGLYREDLARRSKEKEEEEKELTRKRKNKELIAALKEKRRAMAVQMDSLDDEILALSRQ